MPLERIGRIHRFVRKKAWAVLLALAAAVYRAGQETGYFPKDIYVFPLLVYALALWCLYMLVTSNAFDKICKRFYERIGKDHRMAAYIVVACCGALAGSVLAVGGYYLFEIHKEHIHALPGIEDSKDKKHAAAEPPQPTPLQPPKAQPESPLHEKPPAVLEPKPLPVKDSPTRHKEKTPPGLTEAKPPDTGFHEKPPDEAYFSLGGGGITVVVSLAALRKSESKPFQLGGIVPVRIHLQGDILYCDVTLWGGQGKPPIEVKNNEFTVRTPGWDKNFTANALEVVDEKGMPIFQMIRKTSTHYVANGYFVFPGGLVVATDNGTTFNPKTVPTGVLKPIFKYPSWKFLGKYTDNSN